MLFYWVARAFVLFEIFHSAIQFAAIPARDSVDVNWLRQPSSIDKLKEFRFAHIQVGRRTISTQ
jgi:hypothetical protein